MAAVWYPRPDQPLPALARIQIVDRPAPPVDRSGTHNAKNKATASDVTSRWQKRLRRFC